MKKKRRYLKDLISVNINRLVLETGYFEIHVRWQCNLRILDVFLESPGGNIAAGLNIGDCNKSEKNQRFRQHPASFLLIHNFRPGLIRRRGYRLSMLPRGWPSSSPAGPSARVLLPAHQQHAAISAKSRARNFQIENAARKDADNIKTNRQLREAWPRWPCPDPAVAAHVRTRHLRDGRSSRRRSADKTWQHQWWLSQRAAARDWLLGTLR